MTWTRSGPRRISGSPEGARTEHEGIQPTEADSVTASIARRQVPGERRPWVEPTLTKHESLTAATQFQQPPQGPPRFPPGDPRNPFLPMDIPCSEGFCP